MQPDIVPKDQINYSTTKLLNQFLQASLMGELAHHFIAIVQNVTVVLFSALTSFQADVYRPMLLLAIIIGDLLLESPSITLYKYEELHTSGYDISVNVRSADCHI